MRVFYSDLAPPLCADNWFEECGIGLSLILGFCKGDTERGMRCGPG